MNSPGSCYVGIDLGTSGLKLTVVAADGLVVTEAEASYDIKAPQSGHAETDPAAWAEALAGAVRQLFGTRDAAGADVSVAAVAVTGQMHGVVLVDADGKAVRPAILWPDQRAAPSLERWTTLDADVRARLANPLVAGMAGPILGWLCENEPESVAAASLITSPKDWVRGLMTGDRSTERSDASATLLWDVVADDWSQGALELSGIRREQLPAMVRSDEPVGATRRFAVPEVGGPGRSASVVAGGADAACALTALKAAQPTDRWQDTLVVNVGTGAQILRPGAAVLARPEPVTHLYADTDGGWYEMLAIQNGGLALAWVQSILGLAWGDFVDAAGSASPGSSGATFVPFLTGERGGVAGPGSTAGWSGLTPTVGRAELARSAFEAVAFTIRRGIEVLGGPEERVVLSGGGTRDPWVRQLVADALGRQLDWVGLRSASAVGAAVLAARGAGAQLPVPAKVATVAPAASPVMEDAYTRWRKAVGYDA